MHKKTAKTVLLLACLGLITAFWGPTSVFAENIKSETKEFNKILTDKIKKKVKNGAYFLLGIESKIKQSHKEIELLRDNKLELKRKINDNKETITRLEEQLQNLDNLIALNKAKIRAGELQIAQRQNKISVLSGEMKNAENELEMQMKSLEKNLTAYYLYTNVFFDRTSDPALIAFLSDENSIGEIIKQNEYLFLLQNANQDMAINIMNIQDSLDEKQNAIEEEKETLLELQNLLTQEKQTLTVSQLSKERLLKTTKGRQAIYEALLELSKREEAQVALEIKRLQENFDFFQSKLDSLKSNSTDLDARDKILAWPVSPARGITAFFRDESYRKALGISHNAIDIRLPQGSKVQSAADGVVTKVADNGFAYSYVIIAHADKLMTLYGHLSEIFVEEGEIVRQGQTIGLSGGIPGTKGAGWLTTGAHLHLEVFNNFQYVDPLDYLPLEYVPVSSLPEKYLNVLTGEETGKVKRLQ